MSATPAEAACAAVAEVALPVPLHRTFDYRVPAAAAPAVRPGVRVLVPFGRRSLTGVVVALKREPSPDAPELREIHEVLDAAPAVSEELLGLCRWAADYYLAPLGDVLRAAVPAGIARAIEKRVALTDEGRLRLGILKGPEGKLAQALARGPRPWRDVVRFGAERIESMARAGLVEIAGEMTRARVAPRTEPWASLAREPTPDDHRALEKAPKQRALLEALRAGGPRPVRDLREAHGPVADALARLVERGLAVVQMREVLRDPFARVGIAPHPAPALTAEQERVLGPIRRAIEEGRYAPFLLHGVTGSGKTEVYLRAIAHAIERGRQALVLVPEISLTPQLTARFRGRFGDDVAVLHSGLSEAERYDQWRRLRGETGTPVRIAVGARSALFAPLERLGVLVVDEEHDASFKQEESPRYHARDLALVRAQRAGAVVILGSATPSLESIYNASVGKLRLLRLEGRVHARAMPRMEVVDLTDAEFVGHRSALLSRELAEAIRDTVAAGEQAILFLNRRGYSSFVVCRDCGRIWECRHCSVSLTHHRGAARLLCHYCGYSEAVPKVCPACGSDRVGMMGVGTERIEDALRGMLPGVRIARLDRDTVTSRTRLEGILAAFARREVDVLVGTQMVAKGHDFPGVTLVGVVFADQGLHFPDFRAAERTFQLLCQVAGRAGRGDRAGRVIVQSFTPNHPAIQAALALDDAGFAAGELAQRRALGYPPAGRLVALRFEGPSPAAVQRAAQSFADRARARIEAPPFAGALRVLGPAEAPLARLRGRTRYQMLLLGRRGDVLRRFVRELLPDPGEAGVPRTVRIIVDVDPVSLL